MTYMIRIHMLRRIIQRSALSYDEIAETHPYAEEMSQDRVLKSQCQFYISNILIQSMSKELMTGDHWAHIHIPENNYLGLEVRDLIRFVTLAIVVIQVELTRHPNLSGEKIRRWRHLEFIKKIVPACLACGTRSIELLSNRIANFLDRLVPCTHTQKSLPHDIGVRWAEVRRN